MPFIQKAGCFLVVLMLGLEGASTGKPETFSLPDSTLLFAGDWNVAIVTPETAEVIPLPTNPEGHQGPSAIPTLSANGTLVASGFPVANDSGKRWKVRCAVAIYSRAAKQWKTYGDFSQVYAGAISPDGSKLAFLADVDSSDSRKLLLLRLDSGEMSELASVGAVWVSWSPDGQKLAIGAKRIEVFDLSTRSMRELADGALPAWSPSGTWIAYLASSGRTVHLVRPDGTSDHSVKDVTGGFFSKANSFGFAPVWSPDETKLLLNYYKGVNLNSRDVVLLDLATGKMTTKLHNGDPIFGWISVHR